jgi:hypothetical protein
MGGGAGFRCALLLVTHLLLGPRDSQVLVSNESGPSRSVVHSSAPFLRRWQLVSTVDVESAAAPNDVTAVMASANIRVFKAHTLHKTPCV